VAVDASIAELRAYASGVLTGSAAIITGPSPLAERVVAHPVTRMVKKLKL
jgi:hypothetical protein